MIVSFAGLSGRADPSQAARLYAHVVAMAGQDVTLVRVGPGAACADPYTANLEVVSLPWDAGRVAAALAAAAAAAGDARIVVADLPGEFLDAPSIRDLVDIAVLTVGPYASDERAALAFLDRQRPAAGGDPRSASGHRLPWLLGCRRGGGGPATAAFATAMTDAPPADGAGGSRVLPVTMGPLTRSEDAALEAGSPARRNLRDGTVLALALRQVLADPHGAGAARPDGVVATEGERIAMTCDERSLSERLRDLADDAEEIARAGGPSETDLRNAAVLDDWVRDVVPTTVLKGLVSNHPNIADGRPVRTTEVFLTDGVTYARTLSRLYALRMPASPVRPSRLQ